LLTGFHHLASSILGFSTGRPSSRESFLDIDDHLCLLQARTQTLILAFQPNELFCSNLLGLAASLLG
jgi:hypothetical protein